MEFRILGPLEVADGGRIVDLGGPRERVLLARLLISAGLVVSADRLAGDLWSGEPPANWLPTLRVYVSRLRGECGTANLPSVRLARGEFLESIPTGDSLAAVFKFDKARVHSAAHVHDATLTFSSHPVPAVDVDLPLR